MILFFITTLLLLSMRDLKFENLNRLLAAQIIQGKFKGNGGWQVNVLSLKSHITTFMIDVKPLQPSNIYSTFDEGFVKIQNIFFLIFFLIVRRKN